MDIDINEFKELLKKIKLIETVELKDINFFKDGKTVHVCPKVIDEFKFTGLCNRDFIEMDLFKCKNTLWKEIR